MLNLQDEIEQEIAKSEEAVAEHGEEARVSPVEIGRMVAERHMMRIAMVTASRLKAYDRADLQLEIRTWLLKELDVASMADLATLAEGAFDPLLRRKWMILKQAADITGALVVDECEGWSPPENMLDWLDIDDYIFDSLVIKAHTLNPHWALDYELEGNA